MGEFETITYEERNRVAWVTLNRPEVLHAFNQQMLEEVHSVWRSCRTNPDVRAVVLTASGEKAFCTGVDRMATSVGVGPDGQRQMDIGSVGGTALHFNDPGDWLSPKSSDLWKPVIAAVNGMACGGAFYMLGDVDIIIAAEHATFFDPHTTYGMAAVFEPMHMLQRMPLGEIMRISLLGAYERMSARRACEIGLVQEVVPADKLLETAAWVAETIASQPATAVQTTVRAIWYARQMGSRHALDVARTLIDTGSRAEDLAEGQQVFTSGQRVEWRLR
jgi:enoyl-CoA hydratase/carnithine racemase